VHTQSRGASQKCLDNRDRVGHYSGSISPPSFLADILADMHLPKVCHSTLLEIETERDGHSLTDPRNVGTVLDVITPGAPQHRIGKNEDSGSEIFLISGHTPKVRESDTCKILTLGVHRRGMFVRAQQLGRKK
jgi:hypothetical protein